MEEFNKEEESIILGIARTALADAEIFDSIAEEFDITDTELKQLQEKIEVVTA